MVAPKNNRKKCFDFVLSTHEKKQIFSWLMFDIDSNERKNEMGNKRNMVKKSGISLAP